ncbi:uncharacterized protein LOC122506366 [Leptopilina heterotoma]|uniref:uncharacterized protein LOC122506366 n=1 Tax=Leptopilina heterotoma TaxID=63436 RepID=UPI001CA7F3BC|nr:uncharacterized protein LOC122506366 [Leptopilina heterotoma]
MPSRKRSNIGSSSRAAKRMRLSRSLNRSQERHRTGNNLVPQRLEENTQNDVIEERERRLRRNRERNALSRLTESLESRESRLASDRLRHISARMQESVEQRRERLANDQLRHASARLEELVEEREERLVTDRQRHTTARLDESVEQRETRLGNDQRRHVMARLDESMEQREARLENDRQRYFTARREESAEHREIRLGNDRQRHVTARLEESAEHRVVRLATNQQRHITARLGESAEQQEVRLANDRQRHFTARLEESAEHREVRLATDRQGHITARLGESAEHEEVRLATDRQRHVTARLEESAEHREVRLETDRQRHITARSEESAEHEEVRLATDRQRHVTAILGESAEHEEVRLATDRQRHVTARLEESAEHREVRLETDRLRHVTARSEESVEHREVRLATDRQRRTTVRLNESVQYNLRLRKEANRIQVIRNNQTNDEISFRRISDRERHIVNRALESSEVRQERLSRDTERHERSNLRQWQNRFESGFFYDPLINYNEVANIGLMSNVCNFCSALKWVNEAKGMCCSSGKIILPALLDPPEPLRSLLDGNHYNSELFLRNTRKYNSAFQMTSFGANELYEPGFRPTCRIQGQVHHLMSSLLPSDNHVSSYLQIYFISDHQDQVDRRLSIFNTLDRTLLLDLQNLLHGINSYIQSFKSALDLLPSDSINHRVFINADCRPIGEHPGTYNAPTVSEVAIIMVGDPTNPRDIVLQKRAGGLFRICETHRSYDALQYPLMFCRGEDGNHFGYRQTNPETGRMTDKKISALEFYSYRIMVRGVHNFLLDFRQLFNQFLVDMYAKIESERLLYIRLNQTKLRAEQYIHLQDAIGRNENIDSLGQMVILPSSFTGGPRYMHSRTQDAFCYVRKFGRPDLFITITTNPRWSEITNNISTGQNAHDRHDIVARVFHLKLKLLITLLKNGKIFGKVQCYMYSVEWQKRGLPHAHILIWLTETMNPNRINDVIRAELPNREVDNKLFELVKRHMVHGPCGPFNRQLICMKEGHCSKRYPKQYVRETVTGEDGYPKYRRLSPEDGGFTTTVKIGEQNITLDNRWIVPYSPVLLRTFETHINVENCNGVKAIKYICKYINKGSDQASIGIVDDNDEVSRYQSGRYISSSEAVWRILEFPIHERFPAVIHLDVHLENGQRVYFRPDNLTERLDNPLNTTLMAFFKICQTDTFARLLLYHEVPSYYTFDKQRRIFSRRKRGESVSGHLGVFKDSAIGRVYTIHPNNSECFHLRLLLQHIRGPTSFESLRTIRGEVHPTYKAACKALGLLEDDHHWEDALTEAALFQCAFKMRELFCILLLFCDPSDPLNLWIKFRNALADDFLRDAQRTISNTTYENTPRLYDLCLQALQEMTLRIGGKILSDFNLPSPVLSLHQPNAEYIRETNYDVNQLLMFVMENEPSLTNEQSTIYHNILSNINCIGSKQMFFLDAPGGTGKTFLINLILSKIRSERKIALAVASSGIAATLLPGGRTAHSMFKIPINIEQSDTPVCFLSKNSPMSDVIRNCSFIVWDECTMAHKKNIEALNRSLQDIRNNSLHMGGITVLFSGDFRQTLPVVTRGTRADEIKASIKNSFLWPFIIRISLSINMRVHVGGEEGAQEFSDTLMMIGEDNMEKTDGLITIPLSLGSVVNSQEQLIASVFPNIEQLPTLQSSWLCDRAILTPTNEQAAQINRKILSLFEAEERTFLSVNTPINENDFIHYPREFLDSVTAPGLPPHELHLKIGTPIMLLRNINPPKMCNGTRLRVRSLHRHIIEAEILTGCASGEIVFISRIPIIPSNYPFEFRRLQFPISLCFAMTINKSQGQTLAMAGLDVSGSECFSHGQLYVASSRVRSSRCLFIYAPTGQTRNIVYSEILTN